MHMHSACSSLLLILAAAHCAAGFSLGGFASGGRAPARATAALTSVLPRRPARRTPSGSLRAEAAGAPRAKKERRDALGAALLWGVALCVSGAQADDGAPAANKLYNLPTSYGCKVSARRATHAWCAPRKPAMRREGVSAPRPLTSQERDNASGLRSQPARTVTEVQA